MFGISGQCSVGINFGSCWWIFQRSKWPSFAVTFRNQLCRRYLVALELALDAELDFEQIPCVHPGHRTGILWPTWGVQKPENPLWFFFGLQHLDHRHVVSPIFTHRSDEFNQQNDDAISCNQGQVDMLGGYPFWTGNVGALVTKMLWLGLHTRLTPLASTNHSRCWDWHILQIWIWLCLRMEYSIPSGGCFNGEHGVPIHISPSH